MEVIHARCAGLDVHKKTVVACVRVAEGTGVRHEVRTFGTTVGELAALEAFRGAVERLVTVPGISTTAAAVIVAEIGTDMSRFPTAGHLRSWVGLCPRLDESAGKHGARRIRQGAPWLKPVLVQSAWAAIRVPNRYRRALYHRLARRSGKKPAAVAVAASLLTAIYSMLRTDQPYRDLGPHHLTAADRARKAQRLAGQLKRLGYEVTLQEAA